MSAGTSGDAVREPTAGLGKGDLIVTIREAKGLPEQLKDRAGGCHTYAKVGFGTTVSPADGVAVVVREWDFGDGYSTKVLEHTCLPKWNTSFGKPLAKDTRVNALVVQVMHKRTLPLKDVVLGCLVLDLNRVVADKVDGWFALVPDAEPTTVEAKADTDVGLGMINLGVEFQPKDETKVDKAKAVAGKTVGMLTGGFSKLKSAVKK